jgi:protein-L-isoaspartate(D-aspartate) O-methyltransferase
MKREQELAIIRRAYAKQVLAKVQVDDPRLELAFTQVRREDFLGPGPWVIRGSTGEYVPTPSADPVHLYVDNVVQVIAERHLNNGQPSGHAKWMASAAIKASEHVVHIGTGTGYYTAIMARLVGPSGKVTGIELDADLAARAKENLSSYPNVPIVNGDGTSVPFDAADVIYVNAGVTRPVDSWLERLTDGGRLILPMTTNQWTGVVFRIERKTSPFSVRAISPVEIIPCDGARDETSEAVLAEAFEKGDCRRVTRLYRNEDVPDNRCWLRGSGWCLAYDRNFLDTVLYNVPATIIVKDARD